jgi:TctA family transporter
VDTESCSLLYEANIHASDALVSRLSVRNSATAVVYHLYLIIIFYHLLQVKFLALLQMLFMQYCIYGLALIQMDFLPVIIAVLFGMMACHNVQQLAYRTAPLVR